VNVGRQSTRLLCDRPRSLCGSEDQMSTDEQGLRAAQARELIGRARMSTRPMRYEYLSDEEKLLRDLAAHLERAIAHPPSADDARLAEERVWKIMSQALQATKTAREECLKAEQIIAEIMEFRCYGNDSARNL
jgi:hypothetical protein